MNISNVNQIKVLIIGLGNIGLGYDFNLDAENFILTHSQAFDKHPFFHIVGGVDLDKVKRLSFEQKFKKKSFKNTSEGIKKLSPDLVVVSTPISTICDILLEVLENKNIKYILCEKPFSFNLYKAKQVNNLAKSNKCNIFVNYMRRSDIGVKELKKRIDNKTIDTPITGHVWYSKGMYNSASHFINLFQYLFGDVLNYDVVNFKKYYDKDTDPDFKLMFNKVDIIFQSLDVNNFFYNAFELFSKNCRVRYERGGEKISIVYEEKKEILTDHVTLSSDTEYLPSDFYRVQWHVVNEISEFIKGKPACLSFAKDATNTLKVLNGLKEIKL